MTLTHDDLDKFALLARQDYNLGKPADWFGAWRGGYFGAQARVNAARYHYDALHRAPLVPPLPLGTELHLADLLFCMDSAFECTVFALNSLGYAAQSDLFLATDDARELRWIGPDNVWSAERRCGKDTKTGYEQVFPSFTRWWNDHRFHIDLIAGNHDVAKHRATIFVGGKLAVPQDLPKKVPVADVPAHVPAFLRAPMETTLLRKEPKIPYGAGPTATVVLESDVWPVFLSFMAKIPGLVLADARTTIRLNEQEFRSAN